MQSPAIENLQRFRHNNLHLKIAPLIDSIIEYVQQPKTVDATWKVTELFLNFLKMKIGFDSYIGHKWMYIYDQLPRLRQECERCVNEIWDGHKTRSRIYADWKIVSVLQKAAQVALEADQLDHTLIGRISRSLHRFFSFSVV